METIYVKNSRYFLHLYINSFQISYIHAESHQSDFAGNVDGSSLYDGTYKRFADWKRIADWKRYHRHQFRQHGLRKRASLSDF